MLEAVAAHAVGADAFAVSIERTTAGFRLLVRPTRPLLAVAVAPPAPPPTRSRPPSTAPRASAAPTSPAPAPASPAPAPASTATATALVAAIEHATARRASDLLLSCGLPPRARIDGDLVELDDDAPDDDELLALVLAASVARAIPGGAYPKVVDLALRKLAFDMPDRPDTPIELFETGRAPTPVLVHFPPVRAAAAEALGETFATLEASTRFRKRVAMTYQAAGSGTTSRRDVDPYGLVYREGAWYLVGWCHLRREIRSFRIDRIHEAAMAPKPKSPDFERPPGFDAAMESAEKKLLAALGKDAPEAETLATGTVVAEPDHVTGGHLRRLVTAARRHVTVEIDYVSASRHQAAHRRIDPYGIVHHAGEWYVVGHCHTRGDVRTFRIDRIAALTDTSERFKPPADFDLAAYRRERLYVPSADAVTVRVHLDPLAVTRVGANWPDGEVTMGDDRSAEILIDCEGFEWVTGWVLGLGRHAWIVGPDDARAAMRERIARVRAAL